MNVFCAPLPSYVLIYTSAKRQQPYFKGTIVLKSYFYYANSLSTWKSMKIKTSSMIFQGPYS